MTKKEINEPLIRLKALLDEIFDKEPTDEELVNAFGEDVCEEYVDIYADIHNLYGSLNNLKTE
jgi:hypothetical protein